MQKLLILFLLGFDEKYKLLRILILPIFLWQWLNSTSKYVTSAWNKVYYENLKKEARYFPWLTLCGYIIITITLPMIS